MLVPLPGVLHAMRRWQLWWVYNCRCALMSRCHCYTADPTGGGVASPIWVLLLFNVCVRSSLLYASVQHSIGQCNADISLDSFVLQTSGQARAWHGARSQCCDSDQQKGCHQCHVRSVGFLDGLIIDCRRRLVSDAVECISSAQSHGPRGSLLASGAA